MFLFYHPNQDPKNLNHYKGVLFELMLKKYLTTLGYDVQLRRKRNSLEYDIEGHARLDGRPLVGEAKAHGSPVAAQDLAAFVGKLVPIRSSKTNVMGIFLSTSRLSAEAEDYHSVLPDASTVKVLSGGKLLSDIANQLSLPSRSTLENAIRRLGYFPLSTHLLVTEEDALLLQISAVDGG